MMKLLKNCNEYVFEVITTKGMMSNVHLMPICSKRCKDRIEAVFTHCETATSVVNRIIII